MAEAASGQLLDEGRGERGIGVGRVHWRSLLASYYRYTARTRQALDPVRLQGRIVDLDSQAGAVRRVQHPIAQLALDRGDRRGEEPLGGEPVRQQGSAMAACIQGLRDLGACSDPDRAVECAGNEGRQHLCDLDRSLWTTNLGELEPRYGAGAEISGSFRVREGLHALVAGDGNRGGLSHLRGVLQGW